MVHSFECVKMHGPKVFLCVRRLMTVRIYLVAKVLVKWWVLRLYHESRFTSRTQYITSP